MNFRLELMESFNSIKIVFYYLSQEPIKILLTHEIAIDQWHNSRMDCTSRVNI